MIEMAKKSTRKAKASGKKSKIYWTGPGSKTDGIHTKKEFIDLVRKMYPERVYRRMRGDTGVPPGSFKNDDVAGWMGFVNAHYV